MENSAFVAKTEEILRLRKEAEIFSSSLRLLKAKLETIDPEVRARLLAEFDEEMARAYLISDDYRQRQTQYMRAFSKLVKEFHIRALALQLRMDDALRK